MKNNINFIEIIQNHALENKNDFEDDLFEYSKENMINIDYLRNDNNYIYITSCLYMFFSTYDIKNRTNDDKEKQYNIREGLLKYLIKTSSYNKEYQKYLIHVFTSIANDKEVMDFYSLNKDEINFIYNNLFINKINH